MPNVPEHPLPYSMVQDLEMLLADVPGRGDTVYRLRRFAGRVYSEGHRDGRLVGYEESRRDEQFRKQHPDA